MRRRQDAELAVMANQETDAPVRTWHVHVVYHLAESESLDIDYLVDDLSEVNLLIQQSFGTKAIERITVDRLNRNSIVPLGSIYGKRHA